MKYAYLQEQGMLSTSEIHPLQNCQILRPAGISQSARNPKIHTRDLGDLNYTSANNRNNRPQRHIYRHLLRQGITESHRRSIDWRCWNLRCLSYLFDRNARQMANSMAVYDGWISKPSDPSKCELYYNVPVTHNTMHIIKP